MDEIWIILPGSSLVAAALEVEHEIRVSVKYLGAVAFLKLEEKRTLGGEGTAAKRQILPSY